MTRLSESIEVKRSAADCYRYLKDFSTVEQWDPGVYRASKLDPGPVGPGTRFEVWLQLPTGRRAMQYTLLNMSDGRELRLKGEAPGFTATDTISFIETGPASCRIDYQADIRFAVGGPVAGRLSRPWLERVGRSAVAGLAAALEDPAPDASPARMDRLMHRSVLPAMRNFTQQGYLAMPNKGLSQSMEGKTVLVTGPTSGLGLATCCQLARQGARLILVGRDRTRLEQACQSIRDFSGRDDLAVHEVDLLDLGAIRTLTRQLCENGTRIDVLVNNAGALFAEREETSAGHERSLAINLMAPWCLTEGLLPLLRASRGRVINVASGGMYLQALKLGDLHGRRGEYDGAKAYARAKRGLVAVTRYWSQQAENQAVSFYSMHPGWAATPGVAKSLPAFNRRLQGRLRDSRMGADTVCWLASTGSLNARHNGLFWFDRRPQLTEIVPGTAVPESDTDVLVDYLRVEARAEDRRQSPAARRSRSAVAA